MTETTYRYRDNRISVRLAAFYYFGRVDSVGMLVDISYSGALIEDTSNRPKIGTPIILQVFFKSPDSLKAATPFKLVGHVVRHTATGFAIEYDDKLDPDARRIVDEAASIVAAPR